MARRRNWIVAHNREVKDVSSEIRVRIVFCVLSTKSPWLNRAYLRGRVGFRERYKEQRLRPTSLTIR